MALFPSPWRSCSGFIARAFQLEFVILGTCDVYKAASDAST
ncbi:MAG: hypothetical protein AAF488_05590 [Planctomycetota bacterium]